MDLYEQDNLSSENPDTGELEEAPLEQEPLEQRGRLFNADG